MKERKALLQVLPYFSIMRKAFSSLEVFKLSGCSIGMWLCRLHTCSYCWYNVSYQAKQHNYTNCIYREEMTEIFLILSACNRMQDQVGILFSSGWYRNRFMLGKYFRKSDIIVQLVLFWSKDLRKKLIWDNNIDYIFIIIKICKSITNRPYSWSLKWKM